MVPHFPPENVTPRFKCMAVAIDKDKNSPHAVRWAIDHLVITNPSIILIHVRHKSTSPHSSSYAESDDSDTNELFIPYRAYCARKGIELKEVVLDDNDVQKALIDFIHQSRLSSIIVGASTRNALARKLKGHDIPGGLMKSAPRFCSVYVVSKGKLLTGRTSLRPMANTANRHEQLSPPGLPRKPDRCAEENGARHAKVAWNSGGIETWHVERRHDTARATARVRARSSPINLAVENSELSNHARNSVSRDSPANDAGPQEALLLGSVDMSGQILDFGTVPNSPRESSVRHSARELEAEMRRLKLELKKTMEMYSSACKEAISAKKKAKELHQWKLEEAREFEEARLAEEAALAIAELEKAKCKAAIEAAEAAQKLAETEAQRRIQAEMKARQEAEVKNRALSALTHTDIQYRKYTIDEIEAATEKFCSSMKIGEGGYGPVYRGRLDHTAVAIKVLRPDAAQGRKQFQQEVEVLSCIRHPNMVLLLGACPEYGCLVYEYMDNGSLEDRLLRRGDTHPISWRKRFKIAAEIATALLFLHQAKPEPLVHRDLKPGNILLDRNYVSKISDVGLARLVPPSVANNVTQYHLTATAGTFCYIDPEYQQTGKLTTKSDIYSLGILLLQIITAKTPMGLAHHVKKAIEGDRFAEVLDPTVTDWPVEEALQFARLSLKCAELRKKDRPDLATVIVPELNRLRELGKNSETHSHSGHSGSGHSHYGPTSHSRTSTLK